MSNSQLDSEETSAALALPRCVVSSYAPLTPDGPLPPGVTEDLVCAAYGISNRARLKRLLSLMGLSRNGTEAALRKALRSALDRPQIRRSRRYLFHEALYQYLTETEEEGPREVYASFIAPAEENRDDGVAYLDVPKFRSLLREADWLPEGGPYDAIRRYSKEEALALFALAFALLQADQADEILACVLQLGHPFVEFFGVQEEELAEVDEGEQPPATLDHEEEVAFPVSSEENGAAGLLADAALEIPGAWRARLTEHEAALAQATTRRREIGGLPVLQPKAFQEAVDAEERAKGALNRFHQQITDEVTEVLGKVQKALEREEGRLQLPSLPAIPEKVDWLDAHAPLLTQISFAAEELERQRKWLTTNVVAEPIASPCGQSLSLREAFECLRLRAEAVDQAVAEVREAQRALAELREHLTDCSSPRQSRALSSLDGEGVRTLLRMSQGIPSLRPLAPLLFRRLSEVEMWESVGCPTNGADLLCQFLNRAANEEPREHQALLSFLPWRTLEELLASGHDELARHFVLITFRETLARRHPFFFDVVWPYEKRWDDRERCIGERLFNLFSALQMLYWKTESLLPLVALLADPGGEPSKREQSERLSAAARRQAAEAVAFKLESVSMTGHFFRLRQLAFNLFFRSLATSVRDLRVRDVQRELTRLQVQLKRGALKREVLASYPEARDLRPDHELSVQRYIEGNLEALDAWVKQEASFERADESSQGTEEELQLKDDVRNALGRLPALRPEEKTGSLYWLEQEVSASIDALRRSEWPQPAFAFFGELPSTRALFASPEEPAGRSGEAPWPSWVDPDPRSERLWVCHLRGEVRWQDLLQDGIAKTLLGRQRSPIEVLDSLIGAGEYEAAAQATRFPTFNRPEIAARAARARELETRRTRAEDRLYEIDRRLRRFERGSVSQSVLQEIDALDADLLATFELLEKGDLEQAEQGGERMMAEVGRIEEFILTAESERQERYRRLRSWLSAAGVSPRADSGIEELERLSQQILDRERPRRAHILRLQDLDAPNVPDALRVAVRDFVRDADRPDCWPSREQAERIDLYLEYFVDTSRSWWDLLRGLDQEDRTYRKIQDLVTLLAKRLPQEIEALAHERPDEVLVLTLLFEWPGQPTAADFHRALCDRQLLHDSEAPLKVEEAAVPSGASQPWIQAQIRVEGLMERTLSPRGTGQTLQEAFLAFGEKRYRAAVELARSARAWALSSGTFSEIGPLVAIYAWSHLETSGQAYERLEVDAVGLLLRHLPRIRERVRRIEEAEWLAWCNRVLQEEPGSARGDAGQLVELLGQMAEAPAGAVIRERFGALLRIAGALAVADLLWEGVRSLAVETVRARTSLLLLLNDLGEDEALHHLFRHAGGHRKYLTAFTALAARARSEPSAKLHAAIHHNLQTLRDLTNRPFKEFANRLARRLQYVAPSLQITVSEILEQRERPDEYTMVVSLVPDESDPPLSLSLELRGDDFETGEGQPRFYEVVRESLLFDRRELELVVRPRDRAASVVALYVKGETASGQEIGETYRFSVRLGSEDRFEQRPLAELLEAYSGCDAKPVTGSAFVGREKELEVLERSVARQNPGAVIVYGVRRLGKTSLLDELRRRHCISFHRGSPTLFLVVPMEEFGISAAASAQFLDLFLRHIQISVRWDPKNADFRKFLQELGVSPKQLDKANLLRDDMEGASFLMQLREYLSYLRELTGNRVRQVVLVLDEFDKLLERYHSGHEADVEQLVNQLRKAATEEPEIGLVLAGSDLMRKILGHYRSALYASATILELDGFYGPEHRTLARRVIAPEGLCDRIVFSEEVVDDIVRITGGHPLYMRVVACASAFLTQRKRVSRGTVIQAVDALVTNTVLQGSVPDPTNMVIQQLQPLELLGREEQALTRLLLLQLARHTSLERSWVTWATLVDDDRLRQIRSEETWTRMRKELFDAKLVVKNEKLHWGFRFPIIGEGLRARFAVEFDIFQEQAMADLKQEPRAREAR